MAIDSSKILSDITVFTKYAKYLPNKKRRETFEEIVDRNKNMHLNKFKDDEGINREHEQIYDTFLKTKKVLPSMRSLQFGGNRR